MLITAAGPFRPKREMSCHRGAENRLRVCTLSSSEPLDCSCSSESPGKTLVTRIPQETPRHSNLIDPGWGSHRIFLWLPRWLPSAARVRDLCLQVPLGLCSDVRSGGGTGLDSALENGAGGRFKRGWKLSFCWNTLFGVASGIVLPSQSYFLKQLKESTRNTTITTPNNSHPWRTD